MNVIVGYQYADTSPDEVIKKDGRIGLELALRLFQDFPWEDQFELISKRRANQLTSTFPTIFFYRDEKQFLSISASGIDGFTVHFENGDQYGWVFVSNNVLERPEDIMVEGLITDFFEEKIDEVLELFERNPLAIPEPWQLSMKPFRWYRPFLYLLLPLLLIFIRLDQPSVAIQLMIGSWAAILVLIFPRLLLNLSYWKNDKDQIIEYHPNKGTLLITNKNESLEVHKSDIKSVDYVHVRASQRAFNDFCYVRLQLAEREIAVTHLTVDPVIFLNLLEVNYHDEEIFFPSLNIHISSKNSEESNEQKREEFLARYADWDAEQLKEVVSKEDYYTALARSAASEILDQRSQT